ncbi:MAG: NAD(P)H-dependent oxidoreductase [Patescibacteria group bacterium]
MKNKKNILLILGHPLSKSFNGALTNAYAQGARKKGFTVRKLELGKLKFDPILRHAYKKRMKIEPDLASAIKDIKWAKHIVFFYPYWWGSCPALLQGFFERVFTPGFAFKFTGNYTWKKLLKGRSARLVLTMDTPPVLDRVVWRSAGIRSIKFNILEFCGIKPVKITRIGPVKSSSEAKKQEWLKKIEKLGEGGE